MKTNNVLAVMLAGTLIGCSTASGAQPPKPLKILLITGGCCHDYAKQKDLLKQGLEARAHVEVTQVHTDDKSTNPPLAIYGNPDYAKGYDLVIHDECAASMSDPSTIQGVLAPHTRGIPGVNLHCAMHSYRIGNAGQKADAGSERARWFEYLGLQSSGHGPKEPLTLTHADKQHDITKTLEDWVTGPEELYNNIQLFPTARPLMTGRQTVKGKDVEAVVTWINDFNGTRVFSTTVGHNNETVADPRYLRLITRGVLWACGKLNDNYLKPEPQAAAPAPEMENLALGKPTKASSEESGKGNLAAKAVDGDASTRWCASGARNNEWLQVDLGKPETLTGCAISWEFDNVPYLHKVEGSPDGTMWFTLIDASSNNESGENIHAFKTEGVRHVKVTFLGQKGRPSSWGSIREFEVFGNTPATPKAGQAANAKAKGRKKAATKASDNTALASDTLPTPEEVAKMPAVASEQKAADVLKDVRVPEGFEATVFATPPAVNYPVFVAAAPDGTLYVSSDGNGSLDRGLHRGRILRVRDTDGDGKADEVKVFVKDVDSPRGLVWDHDRLYLLHPPHISVFIDKNGDGEADEQKVLVKNIAFTFKDRPADHTSNGLELGIDGWIYAAIGDFGFMEAEGTDGRKLQLRGGGVVRFRPDGTGLELFARGTRNILEAAVSPLLDLFARDNTNDGGGWDVRFHHFTGMEDHGYPRLYKNFAEELIAPLNDHGGGSGCGAAWIDEPGIPVQWNNAPFTADWGRGWIYRHALTPNGATFKADQKEFVGFTRPTDLDVDARSRIYVASWKNATFKWAGNDVGYIVRLSPKGYQPPALPDFAKASPSELVKLLENPSHRTRLEAQRTLLRKGMDATAAKALHALAADDAKPLASRVAAVFALKLGLGADSLKHLSSLASDESIQPWVIRAITDDNTVATGVDPKVLLSALKSDNARTRKEAVVGAGRSLGLTGVWADGGTPQRSSVNELRLREFARSLVPLLTDKDAVVAHTAMQVLRQLGVAEPCLAVVDTTGASAKERSAALRVLYGIHRPEVVNALIQRLSTEANFERRQGLITALARLHFIEGTWKGDSWGTRPDTRGPFYQPEAWSETPKIIAALNQAMDKAGGMEAAYIAGEFNRHRIQSESAMEKLLALVATDKTVLPVAVGQLAKLNAVPARALPLLNQTAAAADTTADVRADALQALSRAELDADGIRALIAGLSLLGQAKLDQQTAKLTSEAFLNSNQVEKHHETLAGEAEKLAGEPSIWADAALLRILDRSKTKQKAYGQITDMLEQGWNNPARRTQLIHASVRADKKLLGEKIVAALNDSNPDIASAAKDAVKRLKLETSSSGNGPLIGAMKVDEVLNAVMKTHGTRNRGEEVFTQVGCIACHTTRPDEPLKGPFLGNIATIYKRRELAEAVLLPNKTIAQGFASERFIMKDELEYEGFVTQEAATTVTIRNIAAQEIVLKASDIAQRQKVDKSLMPEGLVAGLPVQDFAALLDYLEALAKGN